jgi:AbrB family looped-hinge helix DNA binding protein
MARRHYVQVSTRFRVEIPMDARKELQIRPGQELEVEISDGALHLLPVPTLDDLTGIAPGLTYKGVREKVDRL